MNDSKHAKTAAASQRAASSKHTEVAAAVPDGESAAAAAALAAAEPAVATANAADGKRKKIIAAILAVVVVALVAAAFALTQCSAAKDAMEPNVIVGTLEGYTDEEIQAMLDKKVAEGMISFSLNTSMYMASSDAETSIKFENPPNNAKLTRLRIVRDDTGEQIYETGYVAPGTYVDVAKLDKSLELGTHTCTGYISSYKEETKQYLGQAACALTITVAS